MQKSGLFPYTSAHRAWIFCKVPGNILKVTSQSCMYCIDKKKCRPQNFCLWYMALLVEYHKVIDREEEKF